MLQFQNLEELITRCLQCHFCKQSRSISIDFGPDEFFQLDSFEHKNNILTLNTIYRYSTVSEEELKDGEPRPHVKYNISFVISTLENKYETNIVGPTTIISDEVFGTQSPNPWPYFFIEGRCQNCESYIVSKDISLGFLKKNIQIVSIEKERYLLYKTDTKYKIIYDFDQDLMFVQKVIPKIRKNQTIYIKKGKPIKLPLYMFDFTDEVKVISKLKTYITFS